MSLVFYKANAKATGTACTFSVSAKVDEKNKGVFVEMIRQTGWNKESRSGSFKGGDKINLKFSAKEAAGMLRALEANKAAWPSYVFREGKWKTGAYHSSDSGSSLIKFEPYYTKGGEKIQLGFSLAASRKADGESQSFAMAFDPDEMVQLREWLKFALDRINNGNHSAAKKRAEQYAKRRREEAEVR